MNEPNCTHMCEDCDQICIAKTVKFIVVSKTKLPIVLGLIGPSDITIAKVVKTM